MSQTPYGGRQKRPTAAIARFRQTIEQARGVANLPTDDREFLTNLEHVLDWLDDREAALKSVSDAAFAVLDADGDPFPQVGMLGAALGAVFPDRIEDTES